MRQCFSFIVLSFFGNNNLEKDFFKARDNGLFYSITELADVCWAIVSCLVKSHPVIFYFAKSK